MTRKEAALERLRTHAATSPGERLCDLREALGLSEVALGRILGVSGPTVHDWEHANKRPVGANPALIEAWSRAAVRDLGDAIEPLLAAAWLTSEERERLAGLSSPPPEAP